MPGVTKVTQSESGFNVNSVPGFERWSTSISSPFQSCSNNIAVKHGNTLETVS